MTTVSTRNFVFVIAYIIPGFTVVATVAARSATVSQWVGVGSAVGPTVGGFMYTTIASVAAGLLLGAVRWLVLDTLHHRTGIVQPKWDFSALQANRLAFEYLVENHFAYYKFYSHLFLAVLVALTNWQLATEVARPWVIWLGTATILALLLVASRNALSKFYDRTRALIGEQGRPNT